MVMLLLLMMMMMIMIVMIIDNDNDPVELFQKRGKWWELIVRLPWTIHINPYYISIYHGILTPVRQICISALMYAFDVTPARKTWFGAGGGGGREGSHGGAAMLSASDYPNAKSHCFHPVKY